MWKLNPVYPLIRALFSSLANSGQKSDVERVGSRVAFENSMFNRIRTVESKSG